MTYLCLQIAWKGGGTEKRLTKGWKAVFWKIKVLPEFLPKMTFSDKGRMIVCFQNDLYFINHFLWKVNYCSGIVKNQIGNLSAVEQALRLIGARSNIYKKGNLLQKARTHSGLEGRQGQGQGGGYLWKTKTKK